MGRPMKTMFRGFGITLVAATTLMLSGTAGVSVLGSAPALAQEAEAPTSLNQLLQMVREGRRRENSENRQREREFARDKARQTELLNQAEAELKAEQARAEELEAASAQNEIDIDNLQKELSETLGEAGELFGVVRQVAQDTKAQIQASLVSAQLPNRDDALDPLTRGRVLPTIEQLETLNSTLLEEMIEQGRIVSFRSALVQPDGTASEGQVVRIGPFTAMKEDTGDFLAYESETDSLKLLARQPAARFREASAQLVDASPNALTVGAVDPSQGAILSLLVRTPSLLERIDQGKTIGYIIIGLGILGVILAVYRFLVLTIVSMQVRGQMRNLDKPKKGNPLGRMLLVYESLYQRVDEETLELKLDEAFLKERPRIEFGLSTIKVAAAVAPLLGLLGTVTGMIVVFQQITLFGTGDPKLMAGGISQALITTVLGLCAAIPLLLLHSFAAGRAREVLQMLEEQSAGLVAARAEQRH